MSDSTPADEERQASRDRVDELRDLAIWLERESRARLQRISRYLHDDPLQLLAAAKLRLDVMADAPERISRDNLEVVADQVHRVLRGIRQLSVELGSAYRADEDLPAALESVARRVEARKGGRVEVTVRANRQPADDELCETICEVVEEVLLEADGSRPAKLACRDGGAGDLAIEIDGGWTGIDLKRARRRIELRGARLEADTESGGRVERVRIVVPARLVRIPVDPETGST